VTTSSSAVDIPFRANRFLHVSTVLFLAVWVWSVIRPEIPEDWLLENLLVFVLLALLAISYRKLALSDLSYAQILVFLCIHEVGAHYQYSAAVPGEWLKQIIHGGRNQYDRIAHFAFGLLLSYPQREVLMRKAGVKGGWAVGLPILTTLALSAIYEIIEAIVASIVDPSDAAAFLGWQGDAWDSQNDMFTAFAGACVAMVVLAAVQRRVKASRAASTVR
jgi:putative membrane protein